eukprot:1296410-Alexandrium_andersonii.AAC.1
MQTAAREELSGTMRPFTRRKPSAPSASRAACVNSRTVAVGGVGVQSPCCGEVRTRTATTPPP